MRKEVYKDVAQTQGKRRKGAKWRRPSQRQRRNVGLGC